MDKVGYPRGLVKYSTENAMLNHWTKEQTIKRVLRPRVLVYSTILLVIIAAIFVSLATRTPFKADVVRDRGVMARVVEAGKVENVYSIQVMNATEAPQRYKISVNGLPGLEITSETTVRLAPTEGRWIAVRVQSPFEAAEPGSHPIHFEIESLDSPGHLIEKSTFMIPK
jgi:polyferredoxin